MAARRYTALIEQGAIHGEVSGVLRLRPSDPLPPGDHADYVRGLDADDVRKLAGCETTGTAWLYPGGGWIKPESLCTAALAEPGVQWQGLTEVHRLESREGFWVAMDANGRERARASIAICATGSAALPFAGRNPGWGDEPFTRVRGQISWLDPQHLVARQPGPLLPLSGQGYALRLPDGRLLFGASSDERNEDPLLRVEDDDFNRRRLTGLCGLQALSSAPRQGRVAWRATTADRLPLVGAWPLPDALAPAHQRRDQCRLMPRVPGLYVLLGLASRGLTWGPLAAEVLAAWINGTPMPLETDLLDAIDPARLRVRRHRRAQAS